MNTAETDRRRLDGLALPEPVRMDVVQRLSQPVTLPPGTSQTPAPDWRVRDDGVGGWQLLDERQGTPRPWAAGDRFGVLHTAARWDADALSALHLRLPRDRWIGLRPANAKHPQWGVCDSLHQEPEAGQPDSSRVAEDALALMPTQDYADLRFLPPVNRPGTLPPGAGSAVLNFLAWLARLQGKDRLTYRGPYPTPALFASLSGSFIPDGPPEEALERFRAGQTELALQGDLVENPLGWRPAAFVAALPEPGLLVHLRDGVQTAWLDGVAFRRVFAPGGVLPAGERIWPESQAADSDYALGLAVLGRPFCRFRRLAPDGTVLQSTRDEAEPANEAVELDTRWLEVLKNWVTVRAHAGLAEAVERLAGQIRMVWQDPSLRLADMHGDELRLHSALWSEFQQRRDSEDAATLAVMLVSDVLELATAPLLRAAQARLEDQRPMLGDAQAVSEWMHAGESLQAEARTRLESALPALLQALLQGEALPAGQS